MSNSCQSEIGKARVNTPLSLHMRGADRQSRSPLKLRVSTDFSHKKQKTPLSQQAKLNVSKNNLNSALSEYFPKINPAFEKPRAGGCGEEIVSLFLIEIKDVGPEQMARQIPPLKALEANLPDSFWTVGGRRSGHCGPLLAMTLRLSSPENVAWLPDRNLTGHKE